MSWRIVLVSNPCKLTLKNNQLHYQPEEAEAVTLPLEDISAIILECKQVVITSSLISELVNYGIVLFSCDDSHMPSGVFTPFHQHSRYAEVSWLQIQATEPFKKRCWQKIIEYKIKNQASILKIKGCDNSDKLNALTSKVLSGDSTNVESHASRVYWQSLFEEFKRQGIDVRNSALNYGYAIIRGAIARYLVCAGFLPAFGLHHNNKLNAFNLADDLMEVLRPFVDDIVFDMFSNFTVDRSNGLTTILTSEERQLLIQVLTNNCLYKNETITILKACELICFSLANAIKQKDPDLLELPLVPYKE